MNTAQRIADGVAVVPVRIVRVAGKKGLQAFDPRLRGRSRNAVRGDLARSFNTVREAHGYSVSRYRAAAAATDEITRRNPMFDTKIAIVDDEP